MQIIDTRKRRLSMCSDIRQSGGVLWEGYFGSFGRALF